MFLAERILNLRFWLRIFLMPDFALVFKVGALAVRLHQYGKLFLFMFFFVGGGGGREEDFFSVFAAVSVCLSDGLRSVGGLRSFR